MDSKRNYQLFCVFFSMVLSSCVSVAKAEYPTDWDGVSDTNQSDVNISGVYIDRPEKWTRGKTVADVGESFSTSIWFLFPIDTKTYSINEFKIIQNVNQIVITLIDDTGSAKYERTFTENSDYEYKDNGLVFKRHNAWFLANMFLGIGLSTDRIYFRKDVHGDLVAKRTHIYRGSIYFIIPIYTKEEQWNIYVKK